MGEAMHIGELILQELRTLNERLAFVENQNKKELKSEEASKFLKINKRYLSVIREKFMQEAYQVGKTWYYSKQELEEVGELIKNGDLDYKLEYVKHKMS